MRILHTEWSGGFGGQEIRILNEMQEMRRRGCHLALATKEDARILPKAKEYETSSSLAAGCLQVHFFPG